MKMLTPDQLKYLLETQNVLMISKRSGVCLTACHRLALLGSSGNFQTKTLQKLSDYFFKEHKVLGAMLGVR